MRLDDKNFFSHCRRGLVKPELLLQAVGDQRRNVLGKLLDDGPQLGQFGTHVADLLQAMSDRLELRRHDCVHRASATDACGFSRYLTPPARRLLRCFLD
jgi:hypothetical protein